MHVTLLIKTRQGQSFNCEQILSIRQKGFGVRRLEEKADTLIVDGARRKILRAFKNHRAILFAGGFKNHWSP